MDVVEPKLTQELSNLYNPERSYAQCYPYKTSMSHGGRNKCSEDFINLVVYITMIRDDDEKVKAFYKNIPIELASEVEKSAYSLKHLMHGTDIKENIDLAKKRVVCPTKEKRDYIEFSMMRSNYDMNMIVQKEKEKLEYSEWDDDEKKAIIDLTDVELEVNGVNLGKIYDLPERYLSNTCTTDTEITYHEDYYILDLYNIALDLQITLPDAEKEISYQPQAQSRFWTDWLLVNTNLSWSERDDALQEIKNYIRSMGWYYDPDPIKMRFIYPDKMRTFRLLAQVPTDREYPSTMPELLAQRNVKLPFARIEFHVFSDSEEHQKCFSNESSQIVPFGDFATRWLILDAERPSMPILTKDTIGKEQFRESFGLEEVRGLNLLNVKQDDAPLYEIIDLFDGWFKFAPSLRKLDFGTMMINDTDKNGINTSWYEVTTDVPLDLSTSPDIKWYDCKGTPIFSPPDAYQGSS